MSIKGDLTTMYVMDKFQAMDAGYRELVKDIYYSLQKLDETKKELQKARELHEKGFRGALINIIYKHPKYFLSMLAFMIALVIGSIDYFVKDRNVTVQTDTVKVETQVKENLKK